MNSVTSMPVSGNKKDSVLWFTKFKKPIPELLPVRETTVASVKYAADRIDDKIKFTDEACAKLVKVPRIFLPTALKGCTYRSVR